MKLSPVLDTHIWLWWLLGDERLSAKEVRFLDDLPRENRPVISAISLWEVAMLVEFERVKLDLPLADFLTTASSPETVKIIPLQAEIVVEMNRLPPTFHRDPADRLIVATARTGQRTLATHDQKIRKSKLARIWKVAGE